MDIKKILDRGIVVSCQALKDEPLHSSFIMSKMALAAKEGGAIAIRANSYDDIVEIKKAVSLPVIGIVKKDYPDSEIYITPTINEIDEVVKAGAEVVAIDATNRKRPNNDSLEELLKIAKEKYPQVFFMADISTYEEGVQAEKIGFHLVSTTLSGYTEYTNNKSLPDVELVEKLSLTLEVPVIAEGGIWTLEDLEQVFNKGCYSCVIGTAITRPREITKRFVNYMGTTHVIK